MFPGVLKLSLKTVGEFSTSMVTGPRMVGMVPEIPVRPETPSPLPSCGLISAPPKPGASGLSPMNEARNDVRRSGSPRVVPVLIGLVVVSPSLHRDGGALGDHVPPMAVVGGGSVSHQADGMVFLAAIEQGLQQILRAIDAAWHFPGFQISHDLAPPGRMAPIRAPSGRSWHVRKRG
jgi:hypothetical protein